MAELQAQWDAFLAGPSAGDWGRSNETWADEPPPWRLPAAEAEQLHNTLIGMDRDDGPPRQEEEEETEEEEEAAEVLPPKGGPRGKGMGIPGKGKWDNLPTIQPQRGRERVGKHWEPEVWRPER